MIPHRGYISEADHACVAEGNKRIATALEWFDGILPALLLEKAQALHAEIDAYEREEFGMPDFENEAA